MNPFAFTRDRLALVDGTQVAYHRLSALAERGLPDVSSFPVTLKILLEGLIRQQGHPAYTEAQVLAFLRRAADDTGEYPFLPGRVLLQDFTGVPCLADLAALRAALARQGRAPRGIEPRLPVDLVIDHSAQVDFHGCPDALARNLELENRRNRERYAFLRWGQAAFRRLRVVPPGVGICHQVNMEYLASGVLVEEGLAFSDTVVGTDSHTPMINSLGVLGWGVGGIEAEAAMLGQPLPMVAPRVVGVRLGGAVLPGVTATDVALTLTALLRARGVVGCFVEFWGPGLEGLSVADRAPLANMAPEYGATAALFPVDRATLDYLRLTGRSAAQVDLVERYCKAQGLFRSGHEAAAVYDAVVDLDLAAVEPSVAGPKRPHDRLALGAVHTAFRAALTAPLEERGFGLSAAARTAATAPAGQLAHGAVVLAAITSCTNTSNPRLMLGAGLLARKAAARGLRPPAWVKTSLAPGSRVVTAYLARTGLLADLETLGFHVVAYGCTTCIGNSGPLPAAVAAAVRADDLVVAAVLSGNRNFEGRIHPLTHANYLCSPPLVVAYALKGRVDGDLRTEPLGVDGAGRPVYLHELWPTDAELDAVLAAASDPALYHACYGDPDAWADEWRALPGAAPELYPWDPASTYIQPPPWVADLPPVPPPVTDIRAARVLAMLGDFVTTDHISPAGSLAADSEAARYLNAHGVANADFNSYGARRGNHEVMARGTFANARLRNRLATRPGGFTRHHPSGENVTIFEAATRYREAGTPLIVLAGRQYGAGSSRDWAAKGPALLGVRAVLAESYERIHRSNLVGMGVLPLEFEPGQSVESMQLTGCETFTISGMVGGLHPGQRLEVSAATPEDCPKTFRAVCRLDTPVEVAYYKHGGVLPYVLRNLLPSPG